MSKKRIQSEATGKIHTIEFESEPDDAMIQEAIDEADKQFLNTSATKRLSQNKEREEVMGGMQLVDPETGEVAYSDEQRQSDLKTAALFELEQKQRSLAKENEDLAAQGSANPLESAAAGAISVPMGLGSLGATLSEKVLPDELKNQESIEARLRLEKAIGEMGGANPIAATTGAVGTNIATMGGVGGTGQLLAQGLIKEAAKQGAKNAVISAAIGSGVRKATGGDTTVKDLLLDAALGGLGGGRNKPLENAITEGSQKVAGKVTGAGKAVVEKGKEVTSRPAGFIANQLENRRINLEQKASQNQAVESLSNAAEQKAPTQGLNVVGTTPRAKQATQRLLKTAKNPEESLQLQRDANLAINSTQEELGLLSRMIKEGEDHAVDFDKRNPQLTVGEEALKRVQPLKTLMTKYGKEISQSVKDIPDDALKTKFEDVTIQTPEGPSTQRIVKNPGVDPREAVIKRMNDISELEGLAVDNKGNLDFSNTSLRGERSSSMRKQIQNDFNEIVDATPMQLHKKRQELRDVIAKVDFKERGAYEKALEAIRQGSSDVLETVSPKYKELSKKYATLAEPSEELARYLKLADETNVPKDLLDQEAGIIARRLTSNAPSNPRIGALIDQIEKRLGEEGIKFDTRLGRVQEMYNMANRFFPEITPGTSLQGQVRNANIPLSRADAVNKAIGAVTKDLGVTSAVRKQHFKDFIESLRTTAKRP